MSAGVHRAFALLATAVVVLAIVWGFVVAGSPDTRRQERLDERRLDALQDIQAEIQDLTRDPSRGGVRISKLPETLEELQKRARRRKITITDPETGAPYEYRVLDSTRYELCATFTLPRDAQWGVFWNHLAGRHCFTIDVMDPP